ncbi:hypothetical protein OAT43_00750 [Candidatus Pelagibacter ubique]|nr:hypothetical protein [Candidatus Pelagibacter ubique]
MKKLLIYLKLLEMKLKYSGPIGYIIYCVIGLSVMIIFWGSLVKLFSFVFLTSFTNIKYLGEIYLLKILFILFGVGALYLSIFGSKNN